MPIAPAPAFQYAVRGNALTADPVEEQAHDQRDRDLEDFLSQLAQWVGYAPGGTPPMTGPPAYAFYAFTGSGYATPPALQVWPMNVVIEALNVTASGSTVTVLVAGVFHVHCQFTYHSTTQGNYAVVRMYHNRGATAIRGVDGVDAGTIVNGYCGVTADGIFTCQANDTFQFAFQSNVGQTIDRDDGAGFWRSYVTLDKIA